MTENKLQLIARTLGGWILASKGAEKGTLAEVLALVTGVMGRGEELQTDNDPIFWFDPKGRFCTRAQTKQEIADSMALMAIAEGVPVDVICQEEADFFERAAKWEAFQEMKCRYLEGLMRIQELEREVQTLRMQASTPTSKRRFADVEHLKELILMAMDLSGTEKLGKDQLIFCLDRAPSWEVDIKTDTAEKEETT